MAWRLKKKDASGKFYESSTQNKSIFNNGKVFLINKRKKIDGVYYYRLTKENSNKLITNRFQRKEIYSLLPNFNHKKKKKITKEVKNNYGPEKNLSSQKNCHKKITR